MTRVVDFEETTFSTRSRGVLPAFGPQISESGRATHSLAPEKPGWPPTFTCPLSLAQRLTPHASPAGQAGHRPSPAGYCHPPTAELTKTERDPISTSGPSLFSMSPEFSKLPNQAIRADKSVRFPPLVAARTL